jgi:sugar lactone lactonase YvrE
MPFIGSLAFFGLLVTLTVVVVTILNAVTTLVGNERFGYSNSIEFNNPTSLVFDSLGDMYVTDTGNNCIRKVSPQGVVTTFAGSRDQAFADGTGTNAMFNKPEGIAVDSNGNVYVADTSNHRIRRITPGGVVTTFAGTGATAFSNGTALNSSFNTPRGLAFDPAGNLYVSDNSNHCIRRIDTSLNVITWAGSNGTSGFSNAIGTAARFNSPWGMFCESNGTTLLVADPGNHRIRSITLTSAGVNTQAGTGVQGSSNGGQGQLSTYNRPRGVLATRNPAGQLIVYVADTGNNQIRLYSTFASPATVAGATTSGGAIDGASTFSGLNQLAGMAADSNGIVYFADQGNHTIRTLSPYPINGTRNIVSSPITFNRSARYSDTNSSPSILINIVFHMTFDSSGNLYFADGFNHRIRRITPQGVCTTLAGNGGVIFADGTGTNATFQNPSGIAVDSSGNVFVSSTSHNRIRRITPAGVVTTVAGNGGTTFTDGTGTNATFNLPDSLAFNSSGDLFVADNFNHRIRRITPLGVVTTFAGSGTPAFADGTGVGASFRFPTGIIFDSSGNLIVADQGNHRIRRITPGGVVTTIAGTGVTTPITNGAALTSTFNNPYGIVFNSSGDLFITDRVNNRIRRLSGGVVTTLAGDLQGSIIGTGTNARFNSLQGIAINSSGDLFVSDRENFKIRRITQAGVVSTFIGDSQGYSDGGWFANPTGISVNWNGELYLADRDSHTIRRITPEGVVNYVAGSPFLSATTLRFSSPNGIVVQNLTRNTLYVADTGNNRITLLVDSLTNGFGFSNFAGNSASPGFINNTTLISATFNRPQGITIDNSGILYVSEENNNAIRRIGGATGVTTLAGSGTAGSADGIGTAATFNKPFGVVADTFGNVYVADTFNHRIRRITTLDGIVTTLAGSTVGFSNGTGINSQFNFPKGIAIDPLGNLYVADEMNNRIRKIETSTGIVTTLAGSGTIGFLNNSNGLSSTFNSPQGVAVNRFRQVYVSESGNNSIRRIEDAYTLPDNNGVVNTVAGNGVPSFLDGSGIDAVLSRPSGITVDSVGNLYFADRFNHRIRRITPQGDVTTLAGNGVNAFADGTGTNARFFGPNGITVDLEGFVYVADTGNNRIRKISQAGVVTTLVGSTVGSANGVGTNATLNTPNGIAIDSKGNLYVTDSANHRIRKIIKEGFMSTFAGSSAGYLDGIGTNANFSNPSGITIDFTGNLYVTDGSNNRIRKITPTGVVTTLAGSGTAGFGDGSAATAGFNFPFGVAVDSSLNVYVSDFNNHRIRKITSGGIVSTLAGNGTTTFANGTGTNATFNFPQGIAVDSAGTVYVSDTENHRIRRIGYAVQLPLNRGVTTTIAGSGSGGSANNLGTSATFSEPSSIAVNSAGVLYIADSLNHRIRAISLTSVVTTWAGTGTASLVNSARLTSTFNAPRGVTVDSAGNVYVGDTLNHCIRKITTANSVLTLTGSGTPTFADGFGGSASFQNPQGVAVDSVGNVYVADTSNHRIRKITPEGNTTTLAGNGSPAFADGTGGSSSFNTPIGVAVDLSGNVYVGDNSNNRIRKITPEGVVSTLAGNGTADSINGTGTNASFNLPRGIAVDLNYNVYVAEFVGARIRKITPSGSVTTLSGSGTPTFADGTGTAASFVTPRGVAVGSNGIVYVVDTTNHRVRKIL